MESDTQTSHPRPGLDAPSSAALLARSGLWASEHVPGVFGPSGSFATSVVNGCAQVTPAFGTAASKDLQAPPPASWGFPGR